MGGLTSNLRPLVSPSFWRHKLASWRARWFDRRHGIETSVVVPVADMRDVEPALAAHAVQYEPSTLPKFECAMRAIELDHRDFTFIDYGSGKGRVVMLAAAFPFRRVIGIEVSAALHAVATGNVAAFRQRVPTAAPVELICGDARSLAVPEGDLVAYFYNPFDETVLRPVWEGLRNAAVVKRRRLFVLYVNPASRCVFDSATELHCLYDDGAVVAYRWEA